MLVNIGNKDPFSGKPVQPGHTLTEKQAEQVRIWQKNAEIIRKNAPALPDSGRTEKISLPDQNGSH